MIVDNQDINDLIRQSDKDGETKVGSLNEQIEDKSGISSANLVLNR